MRSRITITISSDLLTQIDKSIDNKTLRNRSQAIESLLRQVVSPQISTAVILAGGSLAAHPQTGKLIPKASIPIKGQPVITHLLRHLKNSGINKIVICTSPNSATELKTLLKDGRDFQLKIQYSHEKERLGTGGALKNAAKHLNNEDFILLHGDVLTDINLHELIQFFSESETLAVIAVKPRPGRLPYGRVFIEGNTVTDFQVPNQVSPISMVNAGIYVFSHKVIDLLPGRNKFKLEEVLIPQLVKKQLIKASVFQGIWFDVSDPESYDEANQRWT